MSTNIVNYRVVRGSVALKTINTDVSVSSSLETSWKNNEDRNTQLWIMVHGIVTEKSQSWVVDWKWAISQNDVGKIRTGILILREGAQNERSVDDPPIEKEIFVDALPWLRVGLIYKHGKFSNGYMEFTNDLLKLRAIVESIPAMEELTRLLNN